MVCTTAQAAGSKRARQVVVVMWGLAFTVHSFIEGLALGAQRTFGGVRRQFGSLSCSSTLSVWTDNLPTVDLFSMMGSQGLRIFFLRNHM